MCFPTDFAPVQLRTTSSSPLRKSSKAVTTKAVPTKRTSSAKRSVRFSERTTVAFRHASKEDLQKTWNQRSDISNIKTGIRLTIRALEQANGKLHQLDSNEHTFRGLESGICPTIHKLRKLWIKTTRQNILDEQRIQKAAGVVDVQRLGAIAQASAKEAVRVASKMGRLDARQLQPAA